MVSISRVEERKTLRKRDVPLMYCGRCGSPLKQFGRLTRRRHAARCDYDRERNLASLRDHEKRAKMFTELGEVVVYVMATILGVNAPERVGVQNHNATDHRARTVWSDDGKLG
jgi:hypothetical protein